MVDDVRLHFDSIFARKLFEVRKRQDAPLCVGDLMRQYLGYAAGNFTYHFAGRRAEPSTFQPPFWWWDSTLFRDATVGQFREGPFQAGRGDDQPQMLFDPRAGTKAIVFPRPSSLERDHNLILVSDGELSFRAIQFWLRHNAERPPDEVALRGYLDILGLLDPMPTGRLQRMADWIRLALDPQLSTADSLVPEAIRALAEADLARLADHAVFGINMLGHISFRMVRLPLPQEDEWLPKPLQRLGHPGSDFERHFDQLDTDRCALVIPIELPADGGGIEQLDFRMIYYGSHLGASAKINALSRIGTSGADEWAKALIRSIDAVALAFMSIKIIKQERSRRIITSEAIGHEFKNIVSEIDIDDLMRLIQRERSKLPDGLRRTLQRRLPLMRIPEGLGAFMRVMGKIKVADEIQPEREARLAGGALEEPDKYHFSPEDIETWRHTIRHLYRFFFALYEPRNVLLAEGVPGSEQVDTSDPPEFFLRTEMVFPPVEDQTKSYDLSLSLASMLLEPFRNALKFLRDADVGRSEPRRICWSLKPAFDARVLVLTLYNPAETPSGTKGFSGIALVAELAELTHIGHCQTVPESIDGLSYHTTQLRLFPQYFGMQTVPVEFFPIVAMESQNDDESART